MNPVLKIAVYVFFSCVVVFSSCKKKNTCEVCTTCENCNGSNNKPPISNAGIDQTLALPINTTNLDGSGSSDPDNNITSYVWSKISGPSTFNIINANAIQTQITNLVQGTYEFELRVTDAYGLFSTDRLQINVSNGTSKIIKARIIEYGSDLPVAGAILSVCTSPTGNGPCGTSYLNIIANSNGECFFQASQYSFGGVDHSTEFWSFHWQPCFNTYYGDDSILAGAGLHTADSFTVKIVPKTTITIHLKNTTAVLDQPTVFERGGNFCPNTINDVNYFPGGSFGIYAGIDTTFQYVVFGNAINGFTIFDEWDEFGNPLNIIYQLSIYIPKGSTDTLNIFF